jgi:hypothetical protein
LLGGEEDPATDPPIGAHVGAPLPSCGPRDREEHIQLSPAGVVGSKPLDHVRRWDHPYEALYQAAGGTYADERAKALGSLVAPRFEDHVTSRCWLYPPPVGPLECERL